MSSQQELLEKLKILPEMGLQEIDEFHYDWEILYARLIKDSQKGSMQRRQLFREAYQGINLILTERRKRFGKVMDSMGFNKNTVKHIVALLGEPPAKILDVGCSTGILIESLLELGYDAFGNDVCFENVEIGNQRIAERGLIKGNEKALIKDDFLTLDISTFPPCDLIHSNDVFEHIHPDEAKDFLEKCWKILKPGGWLWLVTPNGLIGPGDATAIKHPPGTPSMGLHLKEYSLRELNNLLKSCGFSVSSRLFSSGRFRRQTQFRTVYTHIKLGMEPLFILLPPSIRRKIMGIMNYSTVIARKI